MIQYAYKGDDAIEKGGYMQTADFPTKEAIIQACRQILERFRTVTLKKIANSDGPVIYVSDEYPGMWLEHVYDSLVWAELSGENEVPKNCVKMFLDNQSADGQLPCYVWDSEVGYTQLQECVSFATLCYETWEKNPDPDFLKFLYEGCSKWDAWLCANRMKGGHGLVEMYCGYDTGHDNSGRLDGMKYRGNLPGKDAAAYPEDCDVAPLIAPDINAVFYADRMALARMAEQLGLPEEAEQWRKKAEEVKRKLFEICYDAEDQFFYDVDKHGNMRKCRNISITNVFTEKMLDPELVRSIFDRYFRNEKEFGTPYPYPSVSAGDSVFEKRYPGNSWGYYCQGGTMLRTLRWMKDYGLESELHENMRKWLSAWTGASSPFGQELDPFTGEPSGCSPWFSQTMLFYLASAKEFGIFDDFA